jgi:hypothetical protein
MHFSRRFPATVVTNTSRKSSAVPLNLVHAEDELPEDAT